MSDILPQDGDCILSQFDQHKLKKARKYHTCCECGYRLKPGEEYIHTAGKWDGRWLSFKVCLKCNGLRIGYEIDHNKPVPFGWLHQFLKGD